MATISYGKKVSVEAINSPKATKKKLFGLSYPFRPSAKGYMTKQTGTILIRGNISQLLKTSIGERVMLPDYGTNLERFVFEPLDETTADQIRDHVLEVLAAYAPEVDVVKFGVFEASKVNYRGLSGFVVKLGLKIRDTGQTTDLEVKIG